MSAISRLCYHLVMARKPTKGRTAIPGADPILHIGSWIRRLGATPATIARKTGLNEGYLSELVNGKKTNPSMVVGFIIADYLDIPVDYFRRPPPSTEVVQEAERLRPDVIARLRRPKIQLD